MISSTVSANHSMPRRWAARACHRDLLPAPTVAVIEEVVADKGYHSRTTVHDLETLEIRTCISEPDRGPQSWTDEEAERDAVYANRRRIRGTRGKRLLRRRGELLERPCAHLSETGGLRRAHVRGHENVLETIVRSCRRVQSRSLDADALRCRHTAQPPGPRCGARRDDHGEVHAHCRRPRSDLVAISRSHAIEHHSDFASLSRTHENRDLHHGLLAPSSVQPATSFTK